MREHARELRLRVRGFNRSAVHKHEASGQREGVDCLVVDAMELEGILHAAGRQLLRQTRTQLCQVSIHLRCVAKRQLLFRIGGRSLAKGDVLLWGELVPAWFKRGSLRGRVRHQK